MHQHRPRSPARGTCQITMSMSITPLPRTSPQYQESQPPSSALRNCIIDAQRRCPASRLCAPVFSPVPSQRGRPSLTRRKAECFDAAVAGVLVVAAVFCASQQCPARYFPFRGRSAPLLTGPVVSRMSGSRRRCSWECTPPQWRWVELWSRLVHQSHWRLC